VGANQYTWVADYDHSGQVGFEDFAWWTPNFQRAKPNDTPLTYPENFPADWRTQNLRLADWQPGAGTLRQTSVPELTAPQLEPVVAEARRRVVESAGPETAAVLDAVSFEIVDLPGDLLGRAQYGGMVQIDFNAAGQGWFIDPTPADDTEFAPTGDPGQLRAVRPDTAAARADLLTAVMHEMAHVLGHTHDDDVALLEATLEPGTRRLPALDEAFAELGD
jgi:hypothetical protein